MNKYEFAVSICGGWTGGKLIVEAKDEDEAYDTVTELIGTRLYEAFPELDIEYNVELENVHVDVNYIKNKLKVAEIACPGDEEIEIFFNDDDDGVYIYRYSEERGSAVPLEGFDDPLYYKGELKEDVEDKLFQNYLVCGL